MFQDFFHPELGAVADRKHLRERQPFRDAGLHDEYRSGTRTGDKITPFGVEGRDGPGKHPMICRCEHADAIRSDQRTSCIADGRSYLLFQKFSGMILLAEAC